LRALQLKGVQISSKNPSAIVASRLARCPLLFDHSAEGYGLREWSNIDASQDASVKPPDSTPRASRLGGTRGDSTTSRILPEAAQYLMSRGKRATGRQIYEAIVLKGIDVGGKEPIAGVCARLSVSPIFDHTPEGYGLREWSDSGSR
jgi:hypothetical protein